MSDFPSAYDPKLVEDEIYKAWEESGFFNPDTVGQESRDKSPETKQSGNSSTLSSKLSARSSFSIVLPPPNVTGTLHLGHATMLAIEDIMIRYHRMKGDDTVWIPGTDHAAIATQNVVEKKLWKEEKKTRHDLGREKFLEKVDEFVQQSKDTIHRQMRKMGASLDWSREAYTLDAPREVAVRTVFKKMYEDGLIYRGHRIVNWCTRCKSTLADDEVNYKEEKTKFYYLKYGPVVIGTARPETKFQDKVIIVHPADERFKALAGTSFDVEWIEGTVKAQVIADEVADPTLGTGAMTITPAHSFEDFKLAQKYKLPIVQIINEDGVLTKAAGDMEGMTVAEARVKVVEQLEKKGLVDHIDENYVHNLSVCYRCDTPIEPLVSEQWFVNVDKEFTIQNPEFKKLIGKGSVTLKEASLAVVKKGEIKIIPDRFENVYYHWMNNLHDWCISRQIWFGHRIPVWYCRGKESGIRNQESGGVGKSHDSEFRIQNSTEGCKPIVSIEEPQVCTQCGSAALEQDPDTLDTWFSSGLWTFSTLGWSDSKTTDNRLPTTDSIGAVDRRPLTVDGRSSDLRRFHPTSVLETGYDIIFFWVARMILMTTYTLGEVPFKTVYLHGLVRDEQGRKMSKSLGNTIDPLIECEKFGTDAVRLALVVGTTPGNDTNLSEKKIEGYRNFVNKLWNIARFVASQSTDNGLPAYRQGRQTTASIGAVDRRQSAVVPATLADRWVLSRTQRVIESVTKDLEDYRLSQAAETLRAFTWDEVADWYLEASKHQAVTSPILYSLLSTLLRLWHPFTPFVTEEIWQKLTRDEGQETSALHDSSLSRVEGAGDKLSALSSQLMIARWPEADPSFIDIKSEEQFAVVQDTTTSIRKVRSVYQVEPKIILPIALKFKDKELQNSVPLIQQLARVEVAGSSVAKSMLRVQTTSRGVTLAIDLGKAIDIEKHVGRIEKTMNELNAHSKSLAETLKNRQFVKNAPKDVIAVRKQTLKDEKAKLKELAQELEELKGMTMTVN